MLKRLEELWTPGVASLVAAAVVVLLVLVAYLLARRALESAGRSGRVSPEVVRMLRRVMRWVALVLVLLVGLQELGMLENAWAALTAVLAMVAIGFVAVWSVLSNALCTVLLLVFKPFRIGDHVELPAEGIAGTAVDLNFAYTILRDEAGHLIQIPNNLFFQKVVRRQPQGGEIELEDQLASRGPAEPERPEQAPVARSETE